MRFRRMPLEDWFDTYQYEVDYDIGESGVKYLKLADLGEDLTKYSFGTGIIGEAQSFADHSGAVRGIWP